MTPAEFAFLAMGLVLGVAAGAALVEFLRARPPAPREVRVTVAQDAIPRRSTTLADDAFVGAVAEPARGGPADRRLAPDGTPELVPAGAPDRRTSVLPAPRVTLAVAAAGAGSTRTAPGRVGIPVDGGADPMLSALRASAAASAVAAMRNPTTAVLDEPRVPTARPAAEAAAATSAKETGPAAAGAGDAGGGETGAAASAGSAAPASAPDSGPCAEPRRLAVERCEVATRARAAAVEAEDAHRSAQRAYDDHQARADAAAVTADARAVRIAKDEAQTYFRQTRSAAQTTDEVEAAARNWLLEVNRINGEAREAAAVLARENEAVRRLTLELERIALDADAARIGAEMAEAACLAARQAVADCEEAAIRPPVAMPPPVPALPPDDNGLDAGDESAGALGSGGTPRIFRLLRGDRTAMMEVVAAMAGDDQDERRRWQLLVSDLVDAILADSIAATALGFPTDHPFWGPFTLSQDRDIASALASLGYRFDGLGGWVDGRVPSQRDLSLAVGFAGLDPMRIRHWPNEAEMGELLRDVTVAADEHLAGAAADLTLGELVTMLGRRADGLAEVWNHWGRLRPLLIEES